MSLNILGPCYVELLFLFADIQIKQKVSYVCKSIILCN